MRLLVGAVIGTLIVLAPGPAAAEAAGAEMVKDVIPDAASSAPSRLTNVGGTLYFVTNPAGGPTRDLWKSDGTGAGTSEVTSLVPSAGSVSDAIAAGGKLFLLADDSTHGQELWASDGTAGGTGMIEDANTGGADGATLPLVDVGGTVYYRGADATHGFELWKSDGTLAGTAMVKDVCTGSGDGLFSALPRPASGVYSNVGQLSGLVLFAGRDCAAGIGDELWRSNGTAAGTALVKDIDPRPKSGAQIFSGSPHSFTQLGSETFFGASDGNETGKHGGELWKTDGTAGGTQMVKDINPGTGGSCCSEVVVAGGELYFIATDGFDTGDHGFELWKSDGSPGGTQMVKDINPGPTGSDIYSLTPVGNKVFFRADDGVHSDELWVSDGTGAGTTRLTDFAAFSQIAHLVNVSGTLFFQGDDGVHGDELWQSDGTVGGTTLVEDIRSGGSSHPDELTAVGHTLFFTADDGTHGIELWKAAAPADTTPPQTQITSGPADGATISDPSPSFAFTANEPAVFQCRVDGGAWAACASPKQIGPLADGAHSFQVRAIDSAFNVDATPAARSFTVKTGPSAGCKRARHQLKRAKKKLHKAKHKLHKAKKSGSHRKIKKAKKKVRKAKHEVKKAKKRKRRKC